MFDSTTAADIPALSQLVGGYVDGSSAWSDADWLRFPGRTLVRFCIWNNRFDAQVIDCEGGNNDAKGVVPFVAGKWARVAQLGPNETPTVYCYTDRGPVGYRISDVRAACDAAGVRRPLILITDFDNDPSTFDPSGDPEIIGKQYANEILTGGHYDASVVADHWPGVDKEGSVTATSNDPLYLGETPGVVVLRSGEVGHLRAIFRWPDGRERTIERKVYAERPGKRTYVIYPPADPDTDQTEDLDAEPGVFIVAVEPAPPQ